MERKVTKYTIIADDDAGAFNRGVGVHVDLGWQPLGAPFVRGSTLVQALVKYAEPPREMHTPVDYSDAGKVVEVNIKAPSQDAPSIWGAYGKGVAEQPAVQEAQRKSTARLRDAVDSVATDGPPTTVPSKFAFDGGSDAQSK